MNRTLTVWIRRARVCGAVALILAVACRGVHAQSDLVLDPSMKPEILDPAAAQVADVLPLDDGDIVVAGQFVYVNGVARETIVRLNADGSLDPSLGEVVTDRPVFRLARGPGGTLYLAGGFTHVGGVARSGLARLSDSGALDATFVPALDATAGAVRALLPVSDGGLYVVQSIGDGQGQTTVRIDRLTAAGALAPGFSPVVLEQTFFEDVALSTNDTIILISGINGVNTLAQRARRFTASGAVDATFQVPPGLDFHPRAVVALADGSMVLGGQGGSAEGRPALVRLLASGAQDTNYGGTVPFQAFAVSFMTALADGSVVVNAFGLDQDRPPNLVHFSPTGQFDATFADQSAIEPDRGSLRPVGLLDGGFVAHGSFVSIGETPIMHVARFTSAGALRADVVTEFAEVGVVQRFAPFGTGEMLVGGTFTRVGEHVRGGVARFSATDAVVTSFPHTDGTVSDILVGSDGQAIVLGDFSAVAGTTSAGIFRAGVDNQVDTTFLAGVATGIASYGSAVVLADGSIVATKHPYSYDYNVPAIVKLLPGSGRDLDFMLNSHDSSKGPSEVPTALALDGANRLLFSAGSFSPMVIQGLERPGVARTDASGVLDTTFAPAVGLAYGGQQIAPGADGGFFIIGRRADAPESSLPTLVRFQPNGALDEGFVLPLATGEYVECYTLTPDGALLVATTSAAGGRQVRRHTMTGALDPSFSIEVRGHGAVSCLAFDGQGRLWMAGSFVEVNGQRRVGLARFALPDLFVAIDGPSQVVVASGASHQLTTTVEGASGTVSYQWYWDGAPVAGATGASLQVSAFDAGKAGGYTVQVTDTSRTRMSNLVDLVLPVPPAITTPPSGLSATLGGSLVLRVTATGLPAPTYQWYRDGDALAGATSGELRLRNLTEADAGAYTVRVSNSAGSITSASAMVAVVPVTIDPGFTPAAVSIQPNTHAGLGAGLGDDSVFVWTYAGESINGISRDGLYLMRGDGTLDPSFAVPGRRIAPPLLVLPDGTSYALEDVTSLNESGTRLRRLSSSGSVDTGFGPLFTASADVVRVGVLTDGRVMAAGGFTHVNGVARAGMVRFLADGSVDAGFNAAAGLSVLDAVISTDGSSVVLVDEGGQPVLRRLQSSGAVDTSFAAVQVGAAGYRPRLNRLQDGTYLLLGNFTTVNGEARNQCARVLATGALAPDFTSRPGGGNVVRTAVMADGSVRLVTREGTSGWSDETYRVIALDATGAVTLDRSHKLTLNYSGGAVSVAILPGGAVVLAGAVIALDEQAVAGFVRINASGEFEPGFQARLGRHEWVHSVCALANGRWAIGGRFTELAGVPRPGIGVVGPDGQIDPTFVPDVGENAGVSRVDRLDGDRLLVTGYFPPFSSGMATESVIVLDADGTRNHSYDSLFAGGVTVAAVSPAGHLFLATPVQPTVRITRLHLDLTPDAGFAPVTVQGGIAASAMSDGRIFLYTENGTITDSVGTSRTALCRITREGLVDATFTAPVLSQAYNVLPREAPGGKLVIAGSFTTVNGVSRPAIARLNDDGSLDPTFTPPTSGLPPAPGINQFAVEPTGRVMVYGKYRSSQSLGANESVLTRLNADGSWDSGIDYVIDTFMGTGIGVITPRENGDVVVAGSFPSLGGRSNLSIARLTANPFQASAVRLRVALPEGGSEYLDIRLSGAIDLPSYRWTRDGQPLPEGDRTVFALREFTAADAGVYRAEVTSADGSTVQTESIEVVVSTATTTSALTPLEFSETGGLGAIRVSAPAGTAWDVTGMPAWVQVAPAVKTGSRTISFELDANRTGGERTASVAVAGRSYEIRQRATSGRLLNISTRGRVGIGDDVLIVGIVTTGSGPTEFLSRGVGPSLARFGVGSLLPNPAIDLKQGASTIDENDDWDGGDDRDLILSESRRVSAFSLTDRAGDAALLTTLAPGSYTARVFDPAGGQGVALAEFYDRTPSTAADPYTRALNISTRGRVGVGGDVLIAGFFISGSVPKQVLVRGVGPGLARFGVADHLVDPFIRVVRSGATVASNDDWAFSAQRDVVEAAARATGAFRLDPQDRDAALVATLTPGSYTVILSGAGGGEGVAIVEVYDME